MEQRQEEVGGNEATKKITEQEGTPNTLTAFIMVDTAGASGAKIALVVVVVVLHAHCCVFKPCHQLKMYTKILYQFV